MPQYKVRYRIITPDADDWMTEEQDFSADDDVSARYRAQAIMDERQQGIREGGTPCSTGTFEVSRADFHPI